MTVDTSQNGRRPRRVAAVLVHHRQPASAAAAVQQLLGQDEPLSGIYVVDNSAHQVPFPRLEHPKLHVITPPRNLGYSGGANVGIRAAQEEGADAVLVVTHDLSLPVGLVSSLVREVTVGVGVVGPLLARKSKPETVWSAGGLDSKSGDVNHHVGHGRVADWSRGAAREVEWLDGACMLITSTALDQVGLFDERYFAYFEDVAYGRACRRAGLAVRMAPSTVAWQDPGTVPADLYLRNRLLYAEGNRGYVRSYGEALFIGLGQLARVVLGRSNQARVTWRGLSWYVFRRFGRPATWN